VAGLMTFPNARSVAPGVSSASTSRAMSMKRRDCSGSSALAGGRGFWSGMDEPYLTFRAVGYEEGVGLTMVGQVHAVIWAGDAVRRVRRRVRVFGRDQLLKVGWIGG
jgi:hypothetical protein